MGSCDDGASKHDVWPQHPDAHVRPVHSKPNDDAADANVWSDDSIRLHDTRSNDAVRLHDSCANDASSAAQVRLVRNKQFVHRSAKRRLLRCWQ
jgi:CRISPR/Cas system endoribonuclease Cas6 (RAMP superfamily)